MVAVRASRDDSRAGGSEMDPFGLCGDESLSLAALGKVLDRGFDASFNLSRFLFGDAQRI